MNTARKTSAPPVLRLAHSMAFTSSLRNLGAPADRYLRDQKLPVLCDDPNVFVPLTRAWAFFDSAAQHEDLTLGWQVGAHVGNHNLNAALLRKLETSPTLFQALQRLIQLASTEASHIQLGIYERQDDVLFYTHYLNMRDVPGYQVAQAYQLGVILGLIRHFLGRNWLPNKIGIEHTITPVDALKYFPGSQILTQQPMGYIAVPRACLHKSIRHTAPQSGVMDDPLLIGNWDFINALRVILKSYLPDGYPSARFAAGIMDVSERTLARRLSASGLTYGTLIDEVRFEEAKTLLQIPGAKIEDVALSVGFDDQSNFTQMFRRIGGLSPGAFRKAIHSSKY